MNLRIDISKLSANQIRTARKWVLVAIVGLLCAQSFIGYILYYSIDSPRHFRQSYSITGQNLDNLHQRTKENLLGLLDFGQKPTQKKQTTPAQIAVSFNLFVESYGVNIPERLGYPLDQKKFFFYCTTYSHLFCGEIPHPPQTV